MVPLRFHLNTMTSFTLKNIPAELHQRLRQAAARNRRSMNSELLARLEAQFAVDADARAVRLKIDQLHARLGAVDHRVIDELKRHGRP